MIFILKDYKADVNSNIKGARGPQHAEIDKALLDWFRKARSKREKATRIAEALDISGEQFKASNGWLDHFKKRTGIKAKFVKENWEMSG